MESRNPTTGERIQSYEELTPKEVEERLERAITAFRGWRECSLEERGARLRRAAVTLREDHVRWSGLVTQEMGKVIAEAKAEVEKCAWACDFYADQAAPFLQPEVVTTEMKKSFVRYDPLGPVLAVMPWNFPFWQVFRGAAPALMAGNVVLLKHASNVSGCALAIEEIFRRAGCPEGVFQTLLVGSSRVEALVADPRVAAVTVTGSEAAGSQVAAAAGRVIKKTVLELGGSDPFILLEDAAWEEACEAGVKARLQNTGQSCIAAKRFIVHQKWVKPFEREMVRRFERLRVGDPQEAATEMGPLARQDLLEEVDRQVRGSIELGAVLVTGGRRLERAGFFYAPTVLSHVRPGMPVAEEEIFGPVAAILPVDSDEEAIVTANQSRFGLGASLWTKDLPKAERLSARLEAGLVYVNSMVRSDPRLPFGGVKRSGYGRELGRQGILEFVNIKAVSVA